MQLGLLLIIYILKLCLLEFLEPPFPVLGPAAEHPVELGALGDVEPVLRLLRLAVLLLQHEHQEGVRPGRFELRDIFSRDLATGLGKKVRQEIQRHNSQDFAKLQQNAKLFTLQGDQSGWLTSC